MRPECLQAGSLEWLDQPTISKVQDGHINDKDMVELLLREMLLVSPLNQPWY
jgi:hypothetical protein